MKPQLDPVDIPCSVLGNQHFARDLILKLFNPIPGASEASSGQTHHVHTINDVADNDLRNTDDCEQPLKQPGHAQRDSTGDLGSSRDLDQRWGTEIIQHIDADMEPARRKIRDKSSGKPTRDTQFMPDLLMTGTAPIGAKQVLLTPCIWFFCGSLWCKRIVKKVTQDLEWPKLLGIGECRFQVGGAVLAAYEDKATETKDSGLKLNLEHGIRLSDQFTAYLHIQDPTTLPISTTIGLPCCATITQNDKILTQKLSRVAGIAKVVVTSFGVSIKFLGLTTCHNLVDACIDSLREGLLGIPLESHHDPQPPSEGICETTDPDSDADSDYYSDDASDNFTNEEAVYENLHTVEDSGSFSDLDWINVSESAGGTFIGLTFGSLKGQIPYRRPLTPGYIEPPGTDLAVFALPLEMLSDVYNTYRDQSGKLINVESHLMDDELGTDEVFLINDLGAVSSAYPLAGTMQFYIRGKGLETIRLKCTQPLEALLKVFITFKKLHFSYYQLAKDGTAAYFGT
ncbi:hypothetical protein VM1G_03329 [Cytospora mali]|uniref:Uncharacterized protein n=1 Tax=Cytospora mali TaxID=578113 RepID=A0A194VUA6_CYTMA|nr:hypothetical protein VM1G_03329 [Valsa mali]